MSTTTLSLRIHPLRYMIRLEGRAEITHPQHGTGAHFHMVIPTYIIDEDLADYAGRLHGNELQGFEASQVHGEVVWDDGARSEIIWVESARSWDQEGYVSLDVEVCDPWPLPGAEFTNHRLLEMPSIVPSLIVDASAHWQSGNTDMADIGMRTMAGLRPAEATPGHEALTRMAALRLPGAVPPQLDPTRFYLPL
jgi:hypothetical protein